MAEYKFKRNRPYGQFNNFREMLEGAYKQHPDYISYRFKEKGKVRDVTTKEFYHTVENFGAALYSIGLENKHISCVGENSYNWIVTLFTIIMSNNVFVPLDKELPCEQIIFLLNQGDVNAVICDGPKEKFIQENIEKLPNIEYVICFDREEDDGKFLSFKKLLEKGASLSKESYDKSGTNVKELKEIVFTSGTTGVSKGVMLSEFNLISNVYGGVSVTRPLDTSLSVLPYNHTYEASCDLLISHLSGTTVCINDSIRNVQANMKLFKPSYMFLVPLFAEHFMSAINKSIDRQGKRKMFDRAVKISNFFRKFGINLTHLLFKDIYREFGGRIKRMVFGGAPLREEVAQFFDNIGIIVSGAYGITECSPGIAINDDKKTDASAGKIMPNVRVKIADQTDERPNGAATGIGEILVKGDTVMLGYYKRPDLTAEAFTEDGWFRTGDYGYLTEDNHIHITGRKKNIIILANGKNIYPEELEEYIQTVPYITEVVVRGVKDGNGMDCALSAEIYMEEPETDEKKIMKDIRNALSVLPSYKMISKFTVRNEPFEKTTTRKIKRF